MKILSSKIHGYLDYVVVIAFLVAPTLFGLSGIPAVISYALSIIHLAVTLLTDFPLGIVKVIPIKLHSTIEFLVSLTLMALPWLLGFASVVPARNFYIAAGVVIFITWIVTDYKVAKTRVEL
ncbi:MAG: hypothetical protein F6K28_13600 [Microcoleus sp. SIO2G3]|nr:hypothetical protein [Microcoleus sp. SIO2G3]